MYQLKNASLTLTLTDRGGLICIECTNGIELHFAADDLCIDTDYGRFCTLDTAPSAVRQDDGVMIFLFDARSYQLSVEYRLEEDACFFQRHIHVMNDKSLSIYRVEAHHEMMCAPLEVLDYNTFWNCPTVGFIRYEDGGLFTGFANPYFTIDSDRTHIKTSFEPSLILKAGEGYRSEANFFGPYRSTGKLLRQQTPPTSMRYNDVSHTRYRNPCGHIPLDFGEISAFQAYARDYLQLRIDHFKLIFYQFFITLPQQPSTDEDEALYNHYIDNFVRMGGDLVTFNPLVRNAPPIPSPDGHWELAPAGSRAERILDYARGKGLEIGFYMGSAAGNSAYCTSPMTPFGQDDCARWKKRDRFGHLASENCIASDEFAEWFYQVQRNTIEKYGITLWDWDPGPGNGFFCYSTDHGHIPGKGAYKGFRNAMNVVERLKDSFPNLYIQGFHGTKEYGLWGFRGFDQHECYWEQDPYNMATIYPDFSEDRLTAGGMRFQSAWNQLFRFMPPEINHALASRMTQYCQMPGELRHLYDQLGWKYAFFSALAVGASMTVTMIPYDLDSISHGEYLEIYQKWIPWAREHFSYARHSKPFGTQVACGAMDGFARIKDDHGYLFLFNPGPVPVLADFELGDEIGLTRPGDYSLVELYPRDGVPLYDTVNRADVYQVGERVHMLLDPYSSTVLELGKSSRSSAPRWCNAPGRMTIDGRRAVITDCEGPDGTVTSGVIACAESIDAVSVNGTPMPFARGGDAIEVPMRFGPLALPVALEEWLDGDRPFSPVRHAACGPVALETRFTAPSAIARRLQRDVPADVDRQQLIIGDMRVALHRDNYAWAQPYRLHLMFPFAHLDHVERLSVSLNGVPLLLTLFDAWHDHIQAKILYYADITDCVRWDEENRLSLTVDAMDADSFMGARLCYPDGERVKEVQPCSIARSRLISSKPIGMPRPLLPHAPGERRIAVESAWVAGGIIHENTPYELCASVNLPADEVEGVYASAQISIDGHSGTSLRADQRLVYDPHVGLWRRTLLPGSRSLLIIDGKWIHVWAVSKRGIVSEPMMIPVEWHLHGF